MRQPQPATPTPKQQLQTSALPCPEQAPELLAVVRSSKREIVVVKRADSDESDTRSPVYTCISYESDLNATRTDHE